MPISIGVGGAVKAGHLSVGQGGVVHPVNYGKCGVGGAVKTFYDYSTAGYDHLELYFNYCDVLTGTDPTYGTSLGRNRATINKYGSVTISNNTITIVNDRKNLYSNQVRCIFIRSDVYIVYKNGYKQLIRTVIPNTSSTSDLHGTGFVFKTEVKTDMSTAYVIPVLFTYTGEDEYIRNIPEVGNTTDITLNYYSKENGTNQIGFSGYNAAYGKTGTLKVSLTGTIKGITYPVKCIDAIA